MDTTTPPTKGVVGETARSDARLAICAVTAAVVGFVVLVLLPYAVTDFAPPAGSDILWRVGGPLAVVLSPLAAGLAGAASWWALWRHGDLDDTSRRLHLAVLVVVATFVAVLVSGPGQAALDWWQD